METYAYSGNSFYRLEIDGQGNIISDPVEVDAGEAVRPLITDYLTNNLVKAKIAPGGKVVDEAMSDGDFAAGVLVPVFNQVIERLDLTLEEKNELLHRAFGDNPKIVELVRQYIGENVADAIWGTKSGRYGANNAGPDTPTPSPSNVVTNGPMTQGEGPLPSPASPDANASGPNVSAPADPQGPQTAASPQADTKTGGDPVILFTGQLFYQVTDLSVAGRGLSFRLTRTYLHQTKYRGPLGYSWDHSYNLWLREEQEMQADGSLENVVYRSNGQVRDDRYVQITDDPIDSASTLDTFADAQFEGPPGFFDRLEKTGNGYVLEMVSGVRVYYSSDLVADRIVDLNGNAMTLDYDAELRLTEVRDPVGKRFTFAYDVLNRLRRVRDEEGQREVRYTYGDNGDLISVDLAPDREPVAETDYDYLGADVPALFQHNLVKVTNVLGHAALEVRYGMLEAEWDWNRVIWQRSETGEFEYEYQAVIDGSDAVVDIDLDPTNFPRMAALVRDRRGHIVEHRFNRQGNVVERREALTIDGLRQPVLASFRYNADGVLREETHPDGSRVEYLYGREAFEDGAGTDASPTAVERLAFGLLLKQIVRPRAGLGEQRAIVTDYEYTPARRMRRQRGPYYASGVSLAELPGQQVGEVTFGYDARGNLATMSYPSARLPDGTLQPIPPQQFVYDSNGMITEVSTGGIVTRFEYFADLLRSGFVQRRTEDATGASLATMFETDTLGRVVRVTSQSGAVDETRWNGFDLTLEKRRSDPGTTATAVRFSYNQDRQLVGMDEDIVDESGVAIDGSPRTHGFEYDSFGRLTLFWSGPAANSRDRRVRRILGADGAIKREFDARNVETKIEYDLLGQKIEKVVAPGTPEEQRQHYEYNVSGDITAVVDGAGGRTEFEYDAFGRMGIFRDPDGNETIREFDAAGRVVRQFLQGPAPDTGAVTRWAESEYVYDIVGRQATIRERLFVPGGAGPDRILVTNLTHDPFGRARVRQGPDGGVIRCDYDGLGRLTRFVDSDGNETTWDIDDANRRVQVTSTYDGEDADGNPARHVCRTTVLTDVRGLATRSADALGNETTVAYDSRGLETVRTDAAGRRTRLVRDIYGQVVARVEDVGGRDITTAFTYDDNGNLETVVDPAGKNTTCDFDAANRPWRIRYGDREVVSSFDAAGRERTRTQEDGSVVRRTYTAAGRLASEDVDLAAYLPPAEDAQYRPLPVQPSTFRYTPSGQVAVASTGASVIEFRYDSLGRLLEEESDGALISCRYDDADNRIGVTYPGGRALEYDFTTGGQITNIRQMAQGASYPGDPATAIVRGLVAVRRVAGRVTAADLGVARVLPFYDRGRRPVGADWFDAAGNVLLRERRLFGSLGECRMEQCGNRRRTAEFDDVRRLERAEDRSGAAVIDVTSLAPAPTVGALASDGQQREDQLATGAVGPLIWSIQYTLDDNSNRERTTETIGGNAAAIDSYQIGAFDTYSRVGADAGTYDRAGNLLRLGGRRYRFDAFGRLVATSVAGATGQFSYDALGRLRTSTRSGVTQRFSYCAVELLEIVEGGVPAVQFAYAGRRLCHVAAGGGEYVPLSDLTGSVLGWIDSTGGLVGTMVYDPFGRILQRQGAWVAPIGFRGYWFDEVSGTGLLLARAYLPQLGRFLQRDPAGMLDGTNPYAFAGHAPGMWIDAWGFNSTEVDWGTVAVSAAKTAAVGIGFGIATGFAVGAGIVSLPFVLTVGAVFLVGAGVNAFIKRADEAVQAGETDFTGRAALAAAGDTVGLTYAYEGVTGRDVVTHRVLPSQERSERLGQGLGSITALATGGRSYHFGSGLGAKAIESGAINPYTVLSASRPSYYNPIIFGSYRTPKGLLLEGNIFSGVRAGVGKFAQTGSAGEAYAAVAENADGNFFHIMRHFSDNPVRVHPKTGDPQLHSVFSPQFKGRVVQLLDNAFEVAGHPENAGGFFARQPNGRAVVTILGEPGQLFGTTLGNPAGLPRRGQLPYGAPADIYTTVFNDRGAFIKPITMYPGYPSQ